MCQVARSSQGLADWIGLPSTRQPLPDELDDYCERVFYYAKVWLTERK
jgi:hypothetical protein